METAKNAQVTNKRIKVTKDGPYLVSGGVPVMQETIIANQEGTALAWRFDTKFPLQERCGLCRCGRSKNKPFCDGSHLKAGFVGTETAGEETYLEKPKIFEGSVITLKDVEELCASARFCHRAGGIWNIMKDCEDPKTKQTIIEESCDCPSGRLLVRNPSLRLKTHRSALAVRFGFAEAYLWSRRRERPIAFETA
jgi:CDGSH-type Zn-finger protein